MIDVGNVLSWAAVVPTGFTNCQSCGVPFRPKVLTRCDSCWMPTCPLCLDGNRCGPCVEEQDALRLTGAVE